MEIQSQDDTLENIRPLLEGQKDVIKELIESLDASLSSNFPSDEINVHLQHFLKNSQEPKADYITAHQLLAAGGVDMHDLFAEVIEFSIDSNESEPLHLLPLAKATGEAPLFYLSAWAYFKAGKIDAAIEVCNSIESKLLDFELLKSECLVAKNEIDQACEILEDCIVIAPQDPFVLKKLARIYLALTRHDEALDLLTHIDTISPNDPEASWMFLNLGYDFHQKGIENKIIKNWFAANLEHLAVPQEMRKAVYQYTLTQKSPEQFMDFIDQLPWSEKNFLHEFLQEVSMLLRTTHKNGWHQAAEMVSALLQKQIS